MHDGEDLKNVLDEKGVKYAHLANHLGITRQGVGKLFLMKHISPARKLQIEEYLSGKSSAWADRINKVSEPTAKYKKLVPVYDLQAQASNVSSIDDDLSELPKSYVQVPGFEDCSFAVYVWNHSMYPTYENGCMVIVKEIKRKEAIQYGSVYLLITDEQRVVKRLYEDEDPDQVLLASDNPETRKDGKVKYPGYRVRKELIRKLFLVKGVIKRVEI